MRRWSHNPYALAEIIEGKILSWEPDRLREILAAAFRIGADRLFVPDPAEPSLLDVFDRPEFLSKTFDTVDQVLGTLEPRDRKWIEQRFANNIDGLRRVLPHLVGVRSAHIRPPGAGGRVQGQEVAVYKSGGPLVLNDEVDFLDPVQGALCDCYLIASLVAVAWTDRGDWRRRLNATGHDPRSRPWHAWSFYEGGERQPPLRVTPDVPKDSLDRPTYARSSDGNESWPTLIEKAYAMYRASMSEGNPDYEQYRALDYAEFPDDALAQLTGRKPRSRSDSVLNDRYLKTELRARCDPQTGRTILPTVAWTYPTALDSTHRDAYHPDVTGLVRNHAYAVLGVFEGDDGSEYVALRNPHGKNEFVSDRYFSGEWRIETGASALTVLFDKNATAHQGLLAIPVDWLGRYFESLGWVEPPPR